jgi:hypothetical protein
VADERICQCAGGVARTGVHDEARRLVDDQQVLVLVGDSERRALLDRNLDDRLPFGHLERDLLALLHAVALRAALAVDRDGSTLAQKPLRVRTRAELLE